MKELARVDFLFAAFVLAAVAAAQDGREPLRGSVVHADGSPWGGAKVALLSQPIPGDGRFGKADEVAAVADAKGRFLVALLPGRRYSAWAHEIVDETTYRASHPIDDVRAGLPLELTADEPRPLGTLKLVGLDAWRPHGRIAIRLLSTTANTIVAPCEERDGSIRLPPFPGRTAKIEVLCGGWPLLPWARHVDLTKARAEDVKIWMPRAVRLRCVDAAGKPIAGATFFQTSIALGEAPWPCESAQSDAGGCLVALLPIGTGRTFDWVNYPALFAAPGCAPTSWIRTFRVPLEHDGAKGPALLDAKFRSGLALRVRLVRGDLPLSGLPLRVETSLRCADSDERHRPVVVPVRTSDDGTFAWSADPESHTIVTAVLADADAGVRKPGAGRFPPCPQVLLAYVPKNAAAPALPERLDVADLASLDVQVLQPDGTPADSPLVGLATGIGYPDLLLRAGTDRSGRVRIAVPRGLAMHVCAFSDRGLAIAEIADAASLEAPLRLTLEECQVLRGRVEDKGGRPASFCTVSWSAGGDAGLAGAIAACLGRSVLARTDADGTFAVPLYRGLRYSVSSVTTPGGTDYPRLPEVVAGDEPPEPVRIVID